MLYIVISAGTSVRPPERACVRFHKGVRAVSASRLQPSATGSSLTFPPVRSRNHNGDFISLDSEA